MWPQVCQGKGIGPEKRLEWSRLMYLFMHLLMHSGLIYDSYRIEEKEEEKEKKRNVNRWGERKKRSRGITTN